MLLTKKTSVFRHIGENAITTSWNGDVAEGTLFTLVLRATADAQLSDVLSVGSRFTVAEAYNNNDETLDVAFNFGGKVASSADFALYQNTPNPFMGETVIGFNLPEAAKATITIQDVAGRVISTLDGEYAQGYNEVRFNAANLPAGVLSYKLESANFTATKQMVNAN